MPRAVKISFFSSLEYCFHLVHYLLCRKIMNCICNIHIDLFIVSLYGVRLTRGLGTFGVLDIALEHINLTNILN